MLMAHTVDNTSTTFNPFNDNLYLYEAAVNNGRRSLNCVSGPSRSLPCDGWLRCLRFGCFSIYYGTAKRQEPKGVGVGGSEVGTLLA